MLNRIFIKLVNIVFYLCLPVLCIAQSADTVKNVNPGMNTAVPKGAVMNASPGGAVMNQSPAATQQNSQPGAVLNTTPPKTQTVQKNFKDSLLNKRRNK